MAVRADRDPDLLLHLGQEGTDVADEVVVPGVEGRKMRRHE